MFAREDGYRLKRANEFIRITVVLAVLGALLAGLYTQRLFGRAFPLATLVRVTISAGVIAALSPRWTPTGLTALLECLALAVLYAGLLLALREFDRRDLETLAKILPGR